MLVVLFILTAVFMFTSLHTVSQGTVHVVERFGKFHSIKETGFYIQIPFVERVAKVVPTNMQMMESMQQPVIARDNIIVNAIITIYFQVTDPVRYVYGSHDTLGTMELLATKTIREIVGNIDSSEIQQNDEHVSYQMLTCMSEQLSALGIDAHRIQVVFPK